MEGDKVRVKRVRRERRSERERDSVAACVVAEGSEGDELVEELRVGYVEGGVEGADGADFDMLDELAGSYFPGKPLSELEVGRSSALSKEEDHPERGSTRSDISDVRSDRVAYVLRLTKKDRPVAVRSAQRGELSARMVVRFSTRKTDPVMR